jgi:hypothetical protein
MDSDKVIKRLKQLHAVATLRPGEEKDEGRANEARNAAFLLLKTAADNGFEVQFISSNATAYRGCNVPNGFNGDIAGTETFANVMNDIFGGMARDLRQQKPPPQTGKVINARYAGYCRKCGKGYKAKERVVWIPMAEGERKVGSGASVLHVECAR